MTEKGEIAEICSFVFILLGSNFELCFCRALEIMFWINFDRVKADLLVFVQTNFCFSKSLEK